jgi:hypothetical protein
MYADTALKDPKGLVGVIGKLSLAGVPGSESFA